MMELYYEGSEGTKINLMGDGIYAQSPEDILGHGWKYSSISGVNGVGKIKKFYKDTEEKNLRLSIMTDTESEFNELMYMLHRTFDRDVRRMKPGRLWWNEYYKEVFVIDDKHSEFEEFFESVEKEITLVSVYPYWVKENKFSFDSQDAVSGDLDYGSEGYYAGFDYSEETFDYIIAEVMEKMTNNCIDAANFEMVFYGPATDPAIIIGDNEYRVFTEMAEGEYLVVNSVSKKIELHSVDGYIENVFHLRDKDHYIFQKIPEGINSIFKNSNLGIDITLFDERGEPEWI